MARYQAAFDEASFRLPVNFQSIPSFVLCHVYVPNMVVFLGESIIFYILISFGLIFVSSPNLSNYIWLFLGFLLDLCLVFFGLGDFLIFFF